MIVRLKVRSGCGGHGYEIGFNSMIVRLKAENKSGTRMAGSCFNSMIVRLKVLLNQIIAITTSWVSIL